MPTKKNRQGKTGPNGAFSLSEAMHLGRKQSVGTPHNSKDYTFKNIMTGGKKGAAAGRKSAIETKAGYDVKTRMNVASAKGAGKAARSQRKMKAK